MKYDLGDCTLWEYMFPSDEKPKLLLPEEELDEFEDDDEVCCSRFYFLEDGVGNS